MAPEPSDILVTESMAPDALRRSTRRPMTPMAPRFTPLFPRTPTPPQPSPSPSSSSSRSSEILVAESMTPEDRRRSKRRPITPIASRRTPPLTPTPSPSQHAPSSSPDALDVIDRRSPVGQDLIYRRSPDAQNVIDRRSPDAEDVIDRRSPSLTPPPPTPPASLPPPPVQPAPPAPPVAQPVDPALEKFRTARSFRTRTTLQLQPYTRERALYEAALRKGGLLRAKQAITSTRNKSPPPAVEDDEESYKDNSRSTANRDADEAIVIAPSPPPREPVLIPLIPADFDEYFMEYGQRVEPDQLDSLADQIRENLQGIARLRVNAEKEEKRRAREAKRLKARFERLIREQERGDPDDETYRPLPPKAPPNQAARRPATQAPRRSGLNASAKPPGPVTYTNKKRRLVEPTSESEASAGVRASNTSRPTPPIRQPSPSVSRDRSPSFALPPLEDEAFDFGLSPADPDSATRPRPTTTTPSGSRSGTNDSDSDSNSDSSSTAPMDKRAKIARRMLPAAMLRRLEQEAERKERDRQSARKRSARKRTLSPVRPGRAIVRHGGGDGVEFADFIDMVADGRSSSHSPLMTPPRPIAGDSDSDHDRPIVVESSDSDDESQAEEDNGGHGGGAGGESLAQLYRGDFESLVAGRGRLPKRRVVHAMDRVRADHGHKKSKSKRRRPALGLVKQVRAPLSRGNKAMFQTHLDFQPADRTPLAKNRDRKRKYSHSTPQPRSITAQKHRPRPAIRLDDHVIFASEDFAFDDHADGHEERTPRPAKRAFGRTNSASVVEVETLDAGIGKARSWAYLDKLSVDFGITPLPSGLHCSSTSILGSGRLVELLDISRGSRDVITLPQACAAYSIELYPTFTPVAVDAVVPILFDRIYEATTARILSKDADVVDLAPIRFLADYMVNVDDADDLMSNLQTCMADFGAKLDLLDLPTGRANRHARDTMLKIRWSMVELAICLFSRSGDLTIVQDTIDPLLSLLLTTGFDKAIRPLKRILRGESESPEINDPLLVTWIATLQILRHLNDDDTTLEGLTRKLDSHYPKDQVGPLAAERIWYLVFGLCALQQFEIHGRTSAEYEPMAHWHLVRRAIGPIKISHNEEAEEGAHLDQLQGRDRYIKIMLARCIRLSSVWQWPFDRESFSIATKDLGIIFKDRQYRNLPTESPVDFPAFITQFNMTLTAAPESKRESAFELYLRLVCVAASDLISASQSLAEAKQAERDVQRLVMTIMPVSPVKFNRILPPSARQLGQLINRYSTMVAATYFAPSLLSWLLANSKKWVTFESADFDSRQVTIRGLMYVAVACRQHGQSLHLVVNRLAEILQFLQKELDQQGELSIPVHAPSRLEVERTMVLVVSCIRQVILHGSFDPSQSEVSYPDPCLLHESWTTSVFALDLSKDLKCSTEVVATIQAFLDTRLKALPSKARLGRDKESDSQDEFGSLGFELDDTTLAQLGGAESASDSFQKKDDEFAQILENAICPRIYRLLSDMLPAVKDDESTPSDDQDAFVTRLTKCFSDCAAILVMDHRRLDWSTFIGPFGRMSWSRLADDRGRLQVGLQFMLNVAKVDRGAFSMHEEEFVSLLVRALVGSRLGTEYDYFVAVMKCDKAVEYPLLTDIESTLSNDAVRFMENRLPILEVILTNISDQIQSKSNWATKRKPFIYRCINLIVSSLVSNDKAIHPARVLHKEEYRAFCLQVLAAMRRILGENVVNPSVIPDIKHFL